MREWSPPAQHALLLHLVERLEEKAHGDPVELWQVRKGERELRCVVYHLPSGIHVKVLKGEGFRRTQLCKIEPRSGRAFRKVAEGLNREWLEPQPDSEIITAYCFSYTTRLFVIWP